MLAKININATTRAKSGKKVCLHKAYLRASSSYLSKPHLLKRKKKKKWAQREGISKHYLEYCLYEEIIISASAFRPYVTNFGCTCTINATTDLHLASREGKRNYKTSGSKSPFPRIKFSVMLWFQQSMLEFCIPSNCANPVTINSPTSHYYSRIMEGATTPNTNSKQGKNPPETLDTTAPLHICFHLSCSKGLQQTPYL